MTTRSERHGMRTMPWVLGASLLFLGCAPRTEATPSVSRADELVSAPDSARAPTRLGTVRAGDTVTGSFSPTSMYLSWIFEVRAVREPVVVDAFETHRVSRSAMQVQMTVYRAAEDGAPAGSPIYRSTPSILEMGGHFASTLPRGRYAVVVRTIDLATSGSVSLQVSLPTVGLACGTADGVTCDDATYCARAACGAPGVCQPRPRDCDGSFATALESDFACGCDGEVHPSACAAAVDGDGLAYLGLCRPLVGPITASRDSATRPTVVGGILHGVPERASFSPTSRFLAWTFENVRRNAAVRIDVSYRPVFHETPRELIVSLYRAVDGRPTGVPWVASIPDRVEGGSYRIAGFLPEVGSYLVVVRGAELRTRGTVEASLTLATLGHTCGTSDSVACDDSTYCARPAGTCGGAGTCEPLPRTCASISTPVCGCDGMTYPALCVARIADVSVAFEGECTAGCRVLGCDAGQTCTYRPMRELFECALSATRPVCDAYRVDPGCAGHPPLAAPEGV